jgi:hypothetical protein
MVTRNYLEAFMKDNIKERRKKIQKLIVACKKVTENGIMEIKPESFSAFKDVKSDGFLGGTAWLLTDDIKHWGFEPEPIKMRYAKEHNQWD